MHSNYSMTKQQYGYYYFSNNYNNNNNNNNTNNKIAVVTWEKYVSHVQVIPIETAPTRVHITYGQADTHHYFIHQLDRTNCFIRAVLLELIIITLHYTMYVYFKCNSPRWPYQGLPAPECLSVRQIAKRGVGWPIHRRRTPSMNIGGWKLRRNITYIRKSIEFVMS